MRGRHGWRGCWRGVAALVAACLTAVCIPAASVASVAPSQYAFEGSVSDDIHLDSVTDPDGNTYQPWEENFDFTNLVFYPQSSTKYNLIGGQATYLNQPQVTENVNGYGNCTTTYAIDDTKPLTGYLLFQGGDKAAISVTVTERLTNDPHCNGGTFDGTQTIAWPLIIDERGANGIPYDMRVTPSQFTDPASAYVGEEHHDAGGQLVAPAIVDMTFAPLSFPPTGGSGAGSALDLPSAFARSTRASGTTVRFTASEPGTVTFTIFHAGRGGKPGRRVGSFTHQGEAGKDHFHWSGQLNGRPLAPGRYIAEAVLKSGKYSGPAASARFRVVP